MWGQDWVNFRNNVDERILEVILKQNFGFNQIGMRNHDFGCLLVIGVGNVGFNLRVMVFFIDQERVSRAA